MVVTYQILFLIFLENLFDSRKCIEAGLEKVLASGQQNDQITPKAITVERGRISNLFYKMRKRWNEVKQIQEKFEDKHKAWLETQFLLPAEFYAPPSKGGRPQLDFNEKKERAKQKETKKLREENSIDKLLYSTMTSLHVSDEPWHHDLRFIMKQCMDDHSMAKKYRKVSGSLTSMENIPSGNILLPNRLSSTDSLVYFYDAKHTKHSYMATTKTLKRQNADVLVSYSGLQPEKEKTRPEKMAYGEHEASVPLADLLSHTNKRILEATDCHKLINSDSSNEPIVIETDYKGGWDSATGQSVYKQKFEDEASKEKFVAESLLTTSIVPLRFRCNGKTIWENPTPQGASFCRPLRLAFEKENHETASAIKTDLENQVTEIGKKEQKVEHDGRLFIFKLIFHLCMLDGKARCAANEHRSSQSCSICKAKPNDFNSLSNFTSGKFDENLDCLKYGISPLHQWIRCLEAILHLAYKLDTGRWRKNKSLGDEAKIQAKKAEIQQKLEASMGLVVDMPKQNGAGTTNDGNTARRLFQNSAVFAEVTGISEELIHHLYVLLCVINCSHQIDVQKFEAFCMETAEIWIREYSWYKMPVSIHTLLVHAARYLEMIDMPISFMTEQCIETGNKVSKYARLNHTRKISRLATMTDHMNWLMGISDPVVATKLQTARQERVSDNNDSELPDDAVALLVLIAPSHLNDSGIAD